MKKIIFVFTFALINFVSMAQLKVVSNGNVGINATNPLCKFSISSNGNAYSSAYIYNSSTSNASRALQTSQKVASSGWCYGHVTGVESGSGTNTKLVGVYSWTYRGDGTFTGDRTYGISAYAGNGANGMNYAVRAQLLGSRQGAAIFALVSGDDINVAGKWAGYFAGNVKVRDTIWYGVLGNGSDLRLKKDIRNLDQNNIQKIRLLQAVKYKLRHPSELADFNSTISDTTDIESLMQDINSPKYTVDQIGLIAQDIQQVYPELVLTDEKGYLGVNYIGLIPVLVEAIKEQQNEIDNLKNELLNLKTEIENNLKSSFMTSDNRPTETGDLPILYQNLPNPFNENTEIRYYLPESTTAAKLFLYDMQGTQIKNLEIKQTGQGIEIIHGSELRPGMYLYTLIVDGREVDTKRMILTQK